MNSLAPTVLDQIIQQELGRREKWRRWSKEESSSQLHNEMLAAVNEAEKFLQREILIYWIDGGPPITFSMPGLTPAPIAFNTRFVELSCTLLNVIQSKAPEPASTRVFLQIIAELTLRNGNPTTAVRLFLHSLMMNAGYYIVPGAFDDDVPPEVRMIAWFYGLVHEVGHVAVMEGHSLPEEFLRTTIEDSFEHIISDAYDKLGINPSELDTGPLLRGTHFNDEVTADTVCLMVLWNATARICEARQKEMDPVRLAVSMLQMCRVMNFINVACLVADRIAGSRYDESEGLWSEIAGHVRWLALFETLPTMMRLGLILDPSMTDLKVAEIISENYYPDGRDGVGQIANGLRNAGVIAEDLRLDVIDQRIWEKVIELTHEGPEGIIAKMELARFIKLADELQVSNSDLEALRYISQNGS